MKFVRFASFGDPTEVLKLVDAPAPAAPGAGIAHLQQGGKILLRVGRQA